MEGNQPPTHPLLIPLVLDSIFKNLKVSDLKSCRQVNKVWHENATLSMRQAVIVKFKLESASEAEELSVNQDEILRFLDLVQSELSTFEALPFATNYELQRVKIHQPEFWALCGSSVKSLHLSHISFDSSDIFRRIILKSCPNLEYLVLSFVDVAGSEDEDAEDDQEDDEQEPLVWVEPRFPQIKSLKYLKLHKRTQLGDISYLELLSYFPSIEVLIVKMETPAYTNKIFHALATCREHDPKCWKIKNLYLNFRPFKEPESELNFLLDDHLSLETLVIDRLETLDHCSTLRNILNAHAPSLKSLKLKSFDLNDTFHTYFETMLEKVRILTLNWCYIRSLTFLQKFPGLKKLELSSLTLTLKSDEHKNDWIASSCEELTIDFLGLDDQNDLFLLFKSVPNLVKMRINFCSREVFPWICEVLPKLVCLEVESGNLEDADLSGLDEEDVKKINEDGNLERMSVTVPRPNLSSLKNLKWFRFGHDGASNESKSIGLCSALCGVQQLPKLEHLKVMGFSPEIWKPLCQQYPWRDP